MRRLPGQGMNVTIMRPKSFVGPERLGVFAIFYEWASEGRNFPMIGNGRNLYQLLDVEDLCQVIRNCVEMDAGKVNDTFNIGAEEYATMREDYQAVLDEAGFGKKIITFPAGPVIAALKVLEFLNSRRFILGSMIPLPRIHLFPSIKPKRFWVFLHAIPTSRPWCAITAGIWKTEENWPINRESPTGCPGSRKPLSLSRSFSRRSAPILNSKSPEAETGRIMPSQCNGILRLPSGSDGALDLNCETMNCRLGVNDPDLSTNAINSSINWAISSCAASACFSMATSMRGSLSIFCKMPLQLVQAATEIFSVTLVLSDIRAFSGQ